MSTTSGWERFEQKLYWILLGVLAVAFFIAGYLVFWPENFHYVAVLALIVFLLSILLCLLFLRFEKRIYERVRINLIESLGPLPSNLIALRTAAASRDLPEVLKFTLDSISVGMEAYVRHAFRRSLFKWMAVFLGALVGIVSAYLVARQISIQNDQLKTSLQQAKSQLDQYYLDKALHYREKLLICGKDACNEQDADARAFLLKSLLMIESHRNPDKYVDLTGARLNDVQVQSISAQLDLRGARMDRMQLVESDISGSIVEWESLHRMRVRGSDLVCVNKGAERPVELVLSKYRNPSGELDFRHTLLCGADLGPYDQLVPAGRDDGNIRFGLNWASGRDYVDDIDGIHVLELERVVKSCPAALSKALLIRLQKDKPDVFGDYKITNIQAETCPEIRPGIVAAKLEKVQRSK